MGNEYEVYAFVWDAEEDSEGRYVYRQVYAGGSLHEALAAMVTAKTDLGAGCVKLEWRS